ncbi:hypothetical protein FACS189481_3360 [Clostridia bacterium]|nr:hypothetical protein FACS189481_3360 [Clostridia bacterium]
MKLEKAKILLGSDAEMELQFNPATYVLSCPKSVDRVYEDLKKEGGGVVSGSRDEARILGFKLIFDSYYNEDGTIVNNATKKVVDFAKNQLGRGSKTVQENLEMFSQMIEESQQGQYNGLTFAWGDLIFHGLIHKVDAVYTMFMSDGTPARANTSIVMVETPDPDGFVGGSLGFGGAASSIGSSILNGIGSVVSKGLSGILPF